MAAGARGEREEKPRTEDAGGGWFWPALAALSLGMYGICLRFLFPGYFAPLSPFHIDFYEYVGAAEKSFALLAAHYPRPVSYMAMKILAAAGLRGFMAGAIALAIANLLLTVALTCRLLRCRSRWTFGVAALYFLYPKLSPVKIVGSDVAHAVPLTLVAGLGHWMLGGVDWTLLGSLLLGSLPGIWLGTHVSTKVPEHILRRLLAAMLILIGGKLIAA